MFPGLKTASGERVSPKTALGLSAYFACLRNISEDVGKLPLHVFRKQGRDRFEQPEHPVDYLLSVAPNDDMTAMSFRETLTAHACSFGGGYAEIGHDGAGRANALWALDPTTVKMERRQGALKYVVTVQGVKTVLDASRVLHIHGISYDGIAGYNIPQLAREALGTILAAQKFSGAFFGNGTWLGIMLEHPGSLTDKGLAHLRNSFVGDDL
jgi:HK97 family phage portal protein